MVMEETGKEWKRREGLIWKSKEVVHCGRLRVTGMGKDGRGLGKCRGDGRKGERKRVMGAVLRGRDRG